MPRASSALALALLLIPARARADEARWVTAVVVTGAELPSKAADKLAGAIRAAIASQTSLDLLPSEEEAALFRSPRPRLPRTKKELAGARKHLDDASSAFAALDFAAAVRSVNKAGAVLQPMIGLRVAVDLDRERVQLAIAIAHAQRDETRLEQLLREFANRFPGEPPPSGLWPPDIVNKLKAIASGPATVLNVRSEPGGLVFVDGREIGRSPVRLGSLPAGAHRIEVEAPGRYPTDEWVDTSEGQEATVEIRLAPNLSSLLEKVSASTCNDPELEAAFREVAPAAHVLVCASVEVDNVILRRVDLAEGPPHGATEITRGSNNDAGIALGIGQLFEPKPGAGSTSEVPLWAWLGSGAGLAAVGAGVTLRLLATSTEDRFSERLGALTQKQAYELRNRSSWQARGGGVLLGLGLATIAGVVGFVAFDLTPSG